MQTRNFLQTKHIIFLGVAFGLVVLAAIAATVCLVLIPKTDDKDISVMSWNILAPVWIDRQSIKSRGIVDMKLLDDEVRLLFIIDRVKTEHPDVLHLQEVQVDLFEEIKNRLSESYSPVAFAPNEKEYWKEYLTGNKTYIKNGVATFYKTDKFNLLSHRDFNTSSLGSIALVAVLQSHESSEMMIYVNCHLETGVTPQQSQLRVLQGNAIMSEINRELSHNLTKDSAVLIAGDMNTQSPYPGFTNFKSKGFLDAAEEVSQTPFPTHYYEKPVQIAPNLTTDWVSIDRMFLRSADKSSGKLQVSSFDVPAVNSTETTRKYYAEKLTEILNKNLESPWKTQAWRILHSELYENIQSEAQDPQGGDNNANRVLRLGSDHLPLMAKLRFA